MAHFIPNVLRISPPTLRGLIISASEISCVRNSTVFVLSGRLFLFSIDQSNMRPKTAGERNESDMMEKAKKAMVQTEDPVEKIRLDLVK